VTDKDKNIIAPRALDRAMYDKLSRGKKIGSGFGVYDEGPGLWYWRNRSNEDRSGPFATRAAARQDMCVEILNRSRTIDVDGLPLPRWAITERNEKAN
jgi:hypothetical protein